MKKNKVVSGEEKQSRREMLKKAGKTSAFVLPTIATFAVSELKVSASGMVPPPPGGYGNP